MEENAELPELGKDRMLASLGLVSRNEVDMLFGVLLLMRPPQPSCALCLHSKTMFLKEETLAPCGSALGCRRTGTLMDRLFRTICSG